MSKRQEKIKLVLKTTIKDQGQVEKNVVKATGTLFQRPTMDVLIYDEKTKEGATVNNLLTINEEQVTIKRSGPVNMHQQFIKNQTTESIYKHPHGLIHMETFTKEISYIRRKGWLEIAYTVSLNGQEKRQHFLTLTFDKEDD